MGRSLLLLAMLVVAVSASAGEEVSMMDAGDAMAMPRPAADHRIRYGPAPQQFGELRLPVGSGPHPVALVIHGGCWLAEYDLGYMSSFAAELASEGVATWSIEYRRVGDAGGGWPGTFEDVGTAADTLHRLAGDHDLDLDRVIAVGHSAGGHLALWLAARHRLPADDPLRGAEPLELTGVVSLAGIPDLATYAASEGCGAAVPELIGGPPVGDMSRLRRTSPFAMVPLGVPQVLVTGRLDPIVPREQAERYADVATGSGDRVRSLEIPDVGHFELVNPTTGAWPAVKTAILNLVQPAAEHRPEP